MELKTRLKLEAEARAWELKCLRLHHLAGMLRDLSLNPQTTEPETLAELSHAIRVLATGEGPELAELAPWIAAGLPRRVTSPLAKLRQQESRIARRVTSGVTRRRRVGRRRGH